MKTLAHAQLALASSPITIPKPIAHARIAPARRGHVAIARGAYCKSAGPMSPQRPLVIVNPKAGGGFSERKTARLIGALSEGLGEVDLAFTEAPRHATALARAAALGGRGLVVALGGDGTVSEEVDGLQEASA